MAANLDLQPVSEWKSLRGFTNLFYKENRFWWSTRRGWVNAILWTGMLGGLVSVMLFMLPAVAAATGDPNVVKAGGPIAFGLQMGRSVFFELGSVALAIGVIVLCQDMIVDEKQSGVTEWLLAKPVARRSYILAKSGAATLAVLVLLVALPSAAAYLLLSGRMGTAFPFLPFLSGVGLMTAHTLFYLALTLMLGTFFNSRPPILGISLGILLGGNMLASLVKPLVYITPTVLPKIAALLAGSEPVPAGLVWPPLLACVLWSAIFVLVAVVKFERTEF